MSISWVTVPRFPDYEVSSLAQVRRRFPDARNHAPRILRPWKGNHGYDTVTLVLDGVKTRQLVHRIVCEAFHGPAPTTDHVVAHFDGTRTNNSPENLRWATRSENARDALGHGVLPVGDSHWSRRAPEKTAKGEAHGMAVLVVADVLAIRSASGGIGLGRDLARQFGVSPTLICKIRKRKLWAHVA